MTTTTALRSAGPAGFDATAWLAEHAAGDILITPEGWMTDANGPARRLFRLPEGQGARGMHFRRFCREPARLVEALQSIRETGFIHHWDADLVTFDGWPAYAVVNLAGDFEAGVLVAVRIQLFDIGEWRRAQERTLFGQRIEAIGRLAGGVAHDFNNLLTVIGGHAECLAAGLSPESSLNRSVHAIQASAARAATLTQKLLSFGRRQVLHPSETDPADLVQRVAANLSRESRAHAPIGVEIAGPRCRVRVDVAQVERALSTIARHAIEAMQDDGTLVFRLSRADIGPEWSPTRAFVKPGRFARLDVRCTGMTLDPDAHVRMFEPFFREKGVVRDGLGLPAAFGLVKQSGGYMWVEDEHPGETAFTILLPVTGTDVEPCDSRPAVTTRGTILVVDDDDALRSVITRIVGTQGYAVLEAASLDTASRLARTVPVDVMIMDVFVDGAPSDQMTTELMDALPQVRLLRVSGSPDALETALPADPARVAVLEKPFSAAQLIDGVRALLER